MTHKGIPPDVWIERLIKKWKPILEISNISKEYWIDIASYCEKYKDDILKEPFPSLPMSIKLLSKLDLSKVMFSDFREICKPAKIYMMITHEQLQEIKTKIGIDMVMQMESTLIEQMSIFLNEQIKNDGGVIINGLFETILIEDPIEYKLEMTGHILTFNVYRMKKLKKVRSLINEGKSSN